MKEISVQELHRMITEKAEFQLLDVREEYEFDQANLGGELMPMGTVMEQLQRISRTKPVIVHCRSGARSAAVVNALETQHGFSNLANLKGGILAWAREIDPGMSIL